jgi:murein DD-endopeptidase MepM/ murein hydrolase activator NlpD
MAFRRGHVMAAVALAAVALSWAGRDALPLRRPLVAEPIIVSTAYEEWADTLRRRESLSSLLGDAGLVGADQTALLATARAVNARKLHPGQVVHFRKVRGQPAPYRVMLRPVSTRRVWLERGASGWVQTVEEIPWRTTRLRVSGQIHSSLYEAIDSAITDTILPVAERVALAWAIAEVYDWEVDFTRDVRRGDRFDVVLDRLESPDGELRFGRIWAARVEAARRANYAFYFEHGDSRGFYDQDGRSLRRAFLRAPLQFRRISSRFGTRLHPVLRVWRSHHGIDYSAAHGTPVRATADGIVTRIGRHGGYGNLIELQHLNGIRTRYGHLSRFAARLRVGSRVSQDQTIGYVGSTGLSTAPHLHYEFLVNGRPTNPRRQVREAGSPVPQAARIDFDTRRAELLAQLEPPPSTSEPSVPARDD